MTTPARVATAAVIGVLVVGGAFFMLRQTGSVRRRRARPGSHPDPEPDLIASPDTGAKPVADDPHGGSRDSPVGARSLCVDSVRRAGK